MGKQRREREKEGGDGGKSDNIKTWTTSFVEFEVVFCHCLTLTDKG